MKKTLLILSLLVSSQLYAENLASNGNTSSNSNSNSNGNLNELQRGSVSSGIIYFTGAIVEPTCDLNAKIECIKDNKITPSSKIFTKKIDYIGNNNQLVTISYH